MNDYTIKTRGGIPNHKFNFIINPNIQESKIWYDIGNEDSEGYQSSCWYEITVIYLYYFNKIDVDTLTKNSSHENNLLFHELIQRKDEYTKICSIFDVGAHQGFFSLGLSNICDKLFSIEPFPENFKYLQENIRINKLSNVECVNAFVSHFTQLKTQFNVNDLYRFNNTNIYEFQTDTICLDNFFDKIDDNPLIKIDTEGEEIQVLRGCKNIIDKKSPDFSIELHSFCKDDHNELKQLIDFNKYEIIIMKRNNSQLYRYTSDVLFQDINYIFFRIKK